MRVTSEEARQSLLSVQEVAAQTKGALGGSGYFLIIWGGVWLVGLLGNQFAPSFALPWLWGIAPTLAWISSALLGIRMGRRLHSTLDARIGGFFALLMAFGALWIVIAWPLSWRQIALLIACIFLFGGATAGVLVRSRATILGCLSIVLLTVAGYYLAPTYFWLWSACSLGLTQIGIGVALLAQARHARAQSKRISPAPAVSDSSRNV